MSQKKSSTRKSLPLSIRISLWLIAASILPLLLTLVISELQSRSTLINQASRTMETDAQTHAQLIDNYFAEKLLVLKSLDYTPLVQQYLLDPAGDQQNVPTILQNGLAIQKLVDPDVTLVTFFDTLDLDTVRSIINSENGVNGSGSYAFILDQNGVRVIDPDPTTLFTSVAPLNAKIQQNIVDENRFGKNSTIPLSADATLSSMKSKPKPPITFQEVPAGKNELFQVTRRPL